MALQDMANAHGSWSTCHLCPPVWGHNAACEGWARLVLYLHLPHVSCFIAVILSVRRQSISALLSENLLAFSWFTTKTVLFYPDTVHHYTVHRYIIFSESRLHHFHTVFFIKPSWGKFARCVWPNLHIYELWAPAVQQTRTKRRFEAFFTIRV